jgi:hypothetical protein
MKNEQKKNEQQASQNQTGRQNTGNSQDKNQQPSGTHQPGKTGSQSSAEKSNISVDNEGRIGKAHDQWNNSSNKRNEQDQKNRQEQPGDTQQGPQTKSDKTVTEPEIDAPIYDPEKTEKKIPRMEEQSKSNK